MAVLIDADGYTKQLGDSYPADYLLELARIAPAPIVLVDTDANGKIQTSRFKSFSNGKRLLVTFASED